MIPDKIFWEKRYTDGEIGWDIGDVSTPLKAYFDQLSDKNIRILIPGAGNAYEAEYLFNKGFQNVFVMDISPSAVQNFKKRVPNFPENGIIEADFFEHKGEYDLIVEQTFFCAIHPSQRKKYAEKMHSLIAKNGKLVGLLFDDKLNDDKPPFGGSKEEYLKYFEPYFEIEKMERAYNSIKPREGRELFIKLKKK